MWWPLGWSIDRLIKIGHTDSWLLSLEVPSKTKLADLIDDLHRDLVFRVKRHFKRQTLFRVDSIFRVSFRRRNTCGFLKMPLHRYTHAILCRIPLSLRTRGEVTLDEARTQHLALAQLLRELDIDVVEMPPDENSPLCVFVEDIAVVCNGIALIARPSEPSRLKEVHPELSKLMMIAISTR